MELDELKKSWGVLNKQLQSEPIANEKQIAELIAGYKANTRRSLGRILGLQRLSITVGILALSIILLTWLLLPHLFESEHLRKKIVLFLLFAAASILGGMGWDWKTYRWSRSIRIDEMSVAEVSRRMTTFRQWMKCEVIVISVWIVLFNILNYWAMEYHLMDAGTQTILITSFALFDSLIIYLLYKRFLYKHLNNINKNIEELKDICTE